MALIDRCVTQAENEMDDENDEKEPQEEQSAIVTGRGTSTYCQCQSIDYT